MKLFLKIFFTRPLVFISITVLVGMTTVLERNSIGWGWLYIAIPLFIWCVVMLYHYTGKEEVKEALK